MNALRSAAFALCLVLPALAQRDARPVPGNGTIDQPGSYMLTGDRQAAGGRAAIVVMANDVTLDLNGQSVAGATGIEIRGANGVSVRNGNITTTGTGIVVMNSNNLRIEGLNIRGSGGEIGIMVVASRNAMIAGNLIYNVGLGIFVRGGGSRGNRIANNTVTAGSGGMLGICYNPSDTDREGPRGDLITGNVISGFELGFQASLTSRANLFKGNSVFFRTKAFELLNDTNKESGTDALALP
jgi:parallel beta-helix repeat protein